ncbi:M48 family metalloprotease [Chitinophaga sp.]|uniref:M48 family metalloprotease n=1 Tax=Chitinophaga sp. TaxID=1869181 RepID=UPI002F92F9B3
MTSEIVTVSPAFRKLAVKAVLSIILFIFTYLLLFALSVGLTVLCGWAGLLVVSFGVSVLTIGLGLGLLCMGLMITYFLLKFIFASHKVDRSHLTEITREEEPQLFALIEEIVQEVKTDFPKKIYLSAEVNAAVFYDSSFWSMFFPVKKNLQIGMGLVNSVTRLELKAILAHEFGHFSQRSMKLGSYVYNVNQVIYNMLYDNASYQQNASSIASVGSIIALFVNIAIVIVQGIQWILKENYKLINLTYMGLSREMEFHADAVAASVTGPEPLISSLLRMQLSDQALNMVLGFYDHRYQQSVTSANVYQQQRWMMEYLAADRRLALLEGVPVLTEAHYERYNKSKLVIKNQWASHPSTEDRIAALHKLNIHKAAEKPEPGNVIFQDVKKRQEDFSTRIFSTVNYPAAVVKEDMAAFKAAYEQEYPLFIFPAVFNGYYDRWNPSAMQPAESLATTAHQTPEQLFGDEMVNLAHSLSILENDKALLHQLTVVEHSIKTFDYDGVKYSMTTIYTLMDHLDTTIAANRDQLKANDAAAYAYFHRLAESSGELEKWEKLSGIYSHTVQQTDTRNSCYDALLKAVTFMQESHPYAQIELRLTSVKEPEQTFKAQLSVMLEEPAYQGILLPQQVTLFTNYITQDKIYFQDKAYDEDAVDLLYNVLRAFPAILDLGCKSAKLQWLNMCVEMMEPKAVKIA